MKCMMFFIEPESSDFGCLPPCTKIRFDITTTSAPIDDNDKALIYLYYKSDLVLILDEYRIFDGNSIVAAIGGSLGLFLGFSFFQCGSMLIYNTIDFIKNILLKLKRSKNEVEVLA